jgi:hypothetical protein
MVIHYTDRSDGELVRLQRVLADPRVARLPVLILEEGQPDLTRTLMRLVERSNLLKVRFERYPAQGIA